MAPLPPKLYFRIGEVAGLVGVEPHVLRYWEREFRSIRPTKSAKGQRVYSRKDVEALLVVKDLLYSQGFTIAGAKKRLVRSPSQDGAVEAASASDGAGTGSAASAVVTMHATSSAPAAAVSSSHAAVLAVAHAPAPAVSVAPHGSPGTSREKLSALRSEVEAFLRELGG